MGFTPTVLCRPTGFLKIIEVTVAIICLILIRRYHLHFGGDDTDSFVDRQLTGYICIGGMVLVTCPILIAYLFGDASIEKTVLELIDNFMGFILFVTAGGMLIHIYHEVQDSDVRKAGLGCGSLCIINGVIYLIDMFFANKNRQG